MSEIDKQEEKKVFARSFAKESVSLKQPTYKSPSRIDKTTLLRYLENPYRNASKLQEASIYLKNTNGIYNRILKYYSNMPTFDHLLYPYEIDSKKKSGNADKLLKSYNEVALFMDKINPKYNFRWWYQKLLECGELFVFKLEDSNGIVWKEMPNDMCRISSFENGISRFAMDLSKLNNQAVYDTMPKEIQSLGDKFKNGSIKADKLQDNSWYELEKNAYAFNIIAPFLSKGFPPFSYLFDGLMYVDEMKNLQFENAENENLKIIHQKVPMDDEGELLIDYDLIAEYHEATKRNLPKGIAITTNPLDVNAVTLMRTGSQFVNHRNDALNSLYDDAGINADLFNGNSKSNEAIASGIKIDEMITFEVIGMFENFLNFEISSNKKSSMWRVKMLNITNFSRENEIKIARENLAFGGSRFHALSTCGYTPLQALNVLKGEQALGIDSIMVPAQSSHTMVGDDGGRPTKEENTDQISGQSNKPVRDSN